MMMRSSGGVWWWLPHGRKLGVDWFGGVTLGVGGCELGEEKIRVNYDN